MIVPKGGVKVKDMVVNHDRQSLLEKPVEGRWAVTLNEVWNGVEWYCTVLCIDRM